MYSKALHITLAIALLAIPAASVFAQTPQLPHVFYGSAEAENGLLPSGYTVTAQTADGVTVGSVTLQTAGEYGGPGAYDQKLLVQGESLLPGEDITFHTKGIQADETATFGFGDVEELNLTFPFTAEGAPDTIDGGGADVVVEAPSSGNAKLPTGTNKIVLTNGKSVDLSLSVTTSGTQKEVTISSGSAGKSIEISNKDDATASVSIPDGAKITSNEDWDGKIQAPQSSSNTGGTPPSGYKIGNITVDVGSNKASLALDKAAKITLSGVTGAVGYKEPGASSWQRITDSCNSTSNPSNIPAGGECSVRQGNNTIIWTYHFTTFAELDEEQDDTSSSSGGGGGGSTTDTTDEEDTESTAPGDIDGNGSVGILDFNLLMVNWGDNPSNLAADLTGDGVVDILDFNLIIVNWTV